MPAPKSISFEALPSGDKIYRLYWAGQIQFTSSEDESPKLYAWLREVDQHGLYVPGTRPVRVVQSAGAIPRFHIGSLWRDQSPFRSSGIAEPELIEFEIEAQPSWIPVKANDKNNGAGMGSGNRSHDWINPPDYRLTLEEAPGVRVAAYHSWVVPMRSVNGEELIVPCYELFRAFYAGSSELAWRLLTGPWDSIKCHFIKNVEFHTTDEGDKVIKLAPETGISKGALPFIGALVGSSAMRSGANLVHANLVAHNQEQGERTAWMKAVPPYINECFRIKARVIRFTTRPGFLITKIESASYPLSNTQLVYLQDALFSAPSNPDITSTPEDLPPIESSRQNELENARVAKSGKRRATKRRFHLGIGASFWLDAPRPTKEIADIKCAPHPLGQRDIVPTPPTQVVGVGGVGDSKAPQHGSLELEDDETFNQMAAIQELVSSLTGNVISAWTEWPLVNWTPIEENEYCALPTDHGDDEAIAWARGCDEDTARLAWVIQMTVGGAHIYWIEIERQTRNEQYCSIALRVMNGGDLDAATLRQVLSVCVQHQGVWPKSAPEELASRIAWSKGKHFSDGAGGLRASTILNRLKDLGVLGY